MPTRARKCIEDNFRDFKEFDQRNYDEILGLFENLRSMETQLVGIFVPQETSATRYVFTSEIGAVNRSTIWRLI